METRIEPCDLLKLSLFDITESMYMFYNIPILFLSFRFVKGSKKPAVDFTL